jgi:hypothetical protein
MADYNANKFSKLKIPGHNEWYAALNGALKAFSTYCEENFYSGLSYNTNGSKNWNDFLTGSTTTWSSATQPRRK